MPIAHLGYHTTTDYLTYGGARLAHSPRRPGDWKAAFDALLRADPQAALEIANERLAAASREEEARIAIFV